MVHEASLNCEAPLILVHETGITGVVLVRWQERLREQ